VLVKRIILPLAVILLVFAVTVFIICKKNSCNISKPTVDHPSVSVLLNKAKDFQARGDFAGAKQIYQQLVGEFPNSAEVTNWLKKSEELNIQILFSSKVDPRSAAYEIRPGDTLGKIAREFNTTIELIKKSNHLKDDKIIPGRKIKIWIKPFSILVYKSQNILILKSDGEIIKTYIVSTGKNNSTPVGTFKITSKLANPIWFKAGAVVPAGSPENILGTRWLGIDLPSYGIHGTTEPQTLGQQVTQGCVRMSNPEVEELYTIVPVGTEVVIVE